MVIPVRDRTRLRRPASLCKIMEPLSWRKGSPGSKIHWLWVKGRCYYLMLLEKQKQSLPRKNSWERSAQLFIPGMAGPIFGEKEKPEIPQKSHQSFPRPLAKKQKNRTEWNKTETKALFPRPRQSCLGRQSHRTAASPTSRLLLATILVNVVLVKPKLGQTQKYLCECLQAMPSFRTHMQVRTDNLQSKVMDHFQEQSLGWPLKTGPWKEAAVTYFSTLPITGKQEERQL